MSNKLEHQVKYMIVDKETGDVWCSDIYHSPTGAKTSFYHASRYYDRQVNKYKTIRFDDQDKYKIVKVKFVEVMDES